MYKHYVILILVAHFHNSFVCQVDEPLKMNGDSIYYEFNREGNYMIDLSNTEFSYLKISGDSRSIVQIAHLPHCSNIEFVLQDVRISNLDSLLIQDKISILEVDNKQFFETLPGSLKSLKSLNELNILQPIEFSLSNSLVLGTLNLDHLSLRQLKRSFKDADFSFLANLQNLKSLFISFNYRHFEEFKDCLNGCRHLKFLEIRNCGSCLSSIDVSNLRLINLTHLITNGKFSKEPQINCFFPNLRTVELNMDFSKSLPDFIYANLNLEHLEVHACGYRNYDFKQMENNLKKLVGIEIYLSDFGFEQMEELNARSLEFQNKVKFFNHSHVTYN